MAARPELKLPDTDDYTFTDWLESTAALQRVAYGRDPADLVRDDAFVDGGDGFMTWNFAATVIELSEMMGEVGWKPWQTSRHVDRGAVIKEAVDALHFIGNILRMVECTGAELTGHYKSKQYKNLQRQIDGYDGVSTKCPVCKRALDDVEIIRDHDATYCVCGYQLS